MPCMSYISIYVLLVIVRDVMRTVICLHWPNDPWSVWVCVYVCRRVYMYVFI